MAMSIRDSTGRSTTSGARATSLGRMGPPKAGDGGGRSKATALAAPPTLVPTMTNTSAPPPQMTQSLNQINQRTEELKQSETKPNQLLQEQVGNLRSRISEGPSQRAADFANSDINARAQAAKQALKVNMARRGIAAGSGVASKLESNIDDQARRDAARSTAGIALGRERDVDNLVLGGQGIMGAPNQNELARMSMTNSMMPLAVSASGNIGQQQLGDQQLGLQQYMGTNQLAQQAEQNKMAQMIALLNMQRPTTYF